MPGDKVLPQKTICELIICQCFGSPVTDFAGPFREHEVNLAPSVIVFKAKWSSLS